jgi:hypothetical protein
VASGSGLYVQTMLAITRQTPQTPANGLSWERNTHKVALLLAAGLAAADLSVDTSFGSATYQTAGREVPAGGTYVPGGILLNQGTPSTPSAAESATPGTLTFDAGDSSWPGSTITGAVAAIIYADAVSAPASDPPFVLISFGAAYSTSNGTFTIQWNAAGVWTWVTR